MRPPTTNCIAQLRETWQPTLLALIWLFLLILVKRISISEHAPTWPRRARSSLDAEYLPASLDTEAAWDLDSLWKDLEWASHRVIASLSTVTGLLLAFRSNSAIGRWSAARSKWSDVHATSRSLLRLLSASLLTAPNETKTASATSLNDFARKKDETSKVQEILATVPFFSISLMCEMRGRALYVSSGPGQQSLLRSDLVDVLPPSLLALANRHRGDGPDTTDGLDTARDAEKRQQIANLNSAHTMRRCPGPSASSRSSDKNLALISLVILQRSLDTLHSSSLLASPVYAHCIGLLNSLSSHTTELERIRDTPIPLSVSRHFSRLLTIHTILLPVVVVQNLDSQRWWLATAIVAMVTCMLYGVDSFAAKLSQPMGLDTEDLPLEKYVNEVQDEWSNVIACFSAN